jgi:hypothetical protein
MAEQFTLKVGTAEHYQDIEQNETRLRVPFEILTAEGEVATERIESFPLTATEDEIREVLQRHLTVYTEDFNRYEANKEHQESLNTSQEVAENISGLTL